MLKLATQFSALFLALNFSGALAVGAGSAPEYDAGLRFMKAGKPAEAAALFEHAIRRHPYNALVHYSLANALVKLKMHDRAAQEYRTTFLLQPDGNLSNYCRMAMGAYKLKVPDAVEIAAFHKRIRSTAGGVVTSVASVPDETQSEAKQVFDPAPLLGTTDADKACAAIRRQLSQEKLKHDIKSNTAALSAEARARDTIAQIEKNTQNRIDRLYAPMIEIIDDYGRVRMVRNHLYNPYNAANPHLLKGMEAQIRAEGDAAKDEALRAAGQDRQRYETWMQAQQSSLDEVASNLTNQLTAPSKSGVKLQARGTNLYVRQYIPFSNKSTLNAHSSVVRIVRAQPHAEGEGSDDQPGRKLNVRAEITN